MRGISLFPLVPSKRKQSKATTGVGDKIVNGVRLIGVGNGEIVNGVRVTSSGVIGVRVLNMLVLTALRFNGVRISGGYRTDLIACAPLEHHGRSQEHHGSHSAALVASLVAAAPPQAKTPPKPKTLGLRGSVGKVNST